MVSLTGHLLPGVAVLLSWFVSTGLIVWLVHRPRATYRSAMMGTTLVAMVGIGVIAATRHDNGPTATYAAAAGALATKVTAPAMATRRVPRLFMTTLTPKFMAAMAKSPAFAKV